MTPSPTLEADFIPEEDSNVLDCSPQSIARVEGLGPPDTELVVFFGERPVGGGTTDGEGNYTITLNIGSERPGNYLVEVRTRRRRELVQEVICLVPEPTPTIEI